MSNVTPRLLLTVAAAAIASSFLGCGSDTPATPQAAVSSSIHPSSTGGGAKTCSTNQSVNWSIGSGSGNNVPVKDGDSQNGAGVAVGCKVAGNDAAGYDVAATATLAGQGTVAVTGHVTTSSAPQTGITGKFIDASGLGSFGDTNCTLTLIPSSTDTGVAGGRIEATIVCANATDQKSSNVCEGDSTFRFENCSQ